VHTQKTLAFRDGGGPLETSSLTAGGPRIMSSGNSALDQPLR
jgi:hypothetical protein